MKDPAYWMNQVLVRARDLSAAEAAYRAGQIDEYRLSLARRSYEEAMQKYTDPFGMKGKSSG